MFFFYSRRLKHFCKKAIYEDVFEYQNHTLGKKVHSCWNDEILKTLSTSPNELQLFLGKVNSDRNRFRIENLLRINNNCFDVVIDILFIRLEDLKFH